MAMLISWDSGHKEEVPSNWENKEYEEYCDLSSVHILEESINDTLKDKHP